MALNTKSPRLLDDPWLGAYEDIIRRRHDLVEKRFNEITAMPGSLSEFACAHEYYGLHKLENGWVFREWAPNATAIWLVGDFSDWKVQDDFRLTRLEGRDVWELHVPPDALSHGQFYRLEMCWSEGRGERIPAYARRVVQDKDSMLQAAQIWEPQEYEWKVPDFKVRNSGLTIYEAHVGMAQEEAAVGSYTEFRDNILPRIVKAGYNTIQLMAVMEHPY